MAGIEELPAVVVPGPLSVAVTGGIGAGKSTVSRLFADRGAVLIDADRLAREVVEPGTEGLAEVVAEFGDAILAGDGSLDRTALGGIVFGDEHARKRLESITHPLVRRLFAQRMAAAPDDAIVVNDIPLIRTVPDAARYHLVISVGIADTGKRVGRLVGRGHTEQDARARIAAQISDDQRLALSDVWIDNSADQSALATAVLPVWDRLSEFAANRRAGRCPEPVEPTGGVRRGSRPATLVVARVARAAEAAGLSGVDVRLRGDGAEPSNQFATGLGGFSPIEVVATAADAAHEKALAAGLCRAGLPRRHAGVHGSADPGQNVNLYLRVK